MDALILTYSEDTGLFTNTGRTIPKQEIAQQQTSEYTDWKQIFNGQIEAKTKDLVKAIMDLYGLQSRAAHNRLQQLTSSRHGYYRNTYLDDVSTCEESNCEGIVEYIDYRVSDTLPLAVGETHGNVTVH